MLRAHTIKYRFVRPNRPANERATGKISWTCQISLTKKHFFSPAACKKNISFSLFFRLRRSLKFFKKPKNFRLRRFLTKKSQYKPPMLTKRSSRSDIGWVSNSTATLLPFRGGDAINIPQVCMILSPLTGTGKQNGLSCLRFCSTVYT